MLNKGKTKVGYTINVHITCTGIIRPNNEIYCNLLSDQTIYSLRKIRQIWHYSGTLSVLLIHVSRNITFPFNTEQETQKTVFCAGLQITARPLANATKSCLWATRNQKLVANLATRIMGWIIKTYVKCRFSNHIAWICFTAQASFLVTCTVKVFIL